MCNLLFLGLWSHVCINYSLISCFKIFLWSAVPFNKCVKHEITQVILTN